MNLPLRCTLPILCCALLSGGSVLAQNAPGGGQRPAPPPPSNLQVLPKDISRQDLMSTMRGFTQQLGVDCEFCHAPNPAPKSSDANPNKAKARVMIAMLNDINTKYLTQLGGEHAEHEHHLTCGNCHLGHSEPPAFVPPPRQGGRGPGGPGGPPPAPEGPPRQ